MRVALLLLLTAACGPIEDDMAARRLPKGKRETLFAAAGARPLLAASSTASNSEHLVNSDETLRTALTATAERVASGGQPGTIRVIDAFVLRSALVVDHEVTIYGPAVIDCDGFALTISGAAVLENFKITNSGGIVVAAEGVVLRTLSLSAGAAVPAVDIGAFQGTIIDVVTLSSGTATFASAVRLDNASYTSINKLASNAPILVDVVTSSSEIRLIDCIGGTVDFDGQLWVIRGNRMGTLTGSASSGSSVISGNVMVGANIVTGAGLGSNTISANVEVGNLATLAADSAVTDAVGLNT